VHSLFVDHWVRADQPARVVFFLTLAEAALCWQAAELQQFGDKNSVQGHERMRQLQKLEKVLSYKVKDKASKNVRALRKYDVRERQSCLLLGAMLQLPPHRHLLGPIELVAHKQAERLSLLREMYWRPYGLTALSTSATPDTRTTFTRLRQVLAVLCLFIVFAARAGAVV
jgi:hypothetical protein